MSTAVITLSDSGDESDDLPSFAERVRRLINSEAEKVKANTSPEKNKQVHSVPDNDDSDSRETIPFSNEQSMSPVFSSPDVRKCERNVNRYIPPKTKVLQDLFVSDDDSDSRETVIFSKEKNMSSVFSSLDVPKCVINLNKNIPSKRNILQAHSLSDHESDLETVSKGNNMPVRKCETNVNRHIPPETKVMQAPFVSDDDSDSRETVLFSKEENMSPVCSSPDVPKCVRNISLKRNLSQIHSISDSEDSDSREAIIFCKNKIVSPVFSLLHAPVHDANANINSDVDIPDLNKNVKNRKKMVNSEAEKELTKKIRLQKKKEKEMSQKPKECIKKKKVNSEAEKEKELKQKIRLEKKKEKEMIKALKASEKEILKSQKPEECIKNMKIVLDHNILYLEGSQSAVNALDLNNLKYCIEENNCKYSVNWYRTVINISTTDDEILKEEKDELQNEIIVIIPNEDFLRMVHAFSQKSKGKTVEHLSLAEFIISIKSLYADCAITCVIVGFDKYMRGIKEKGNSDLKSIARQTHKNASDEAVIELQLESPVNFNFLDNMSDFGSLLCQCTKAIAEAPQRREKHMQKSLAFSWYADVDSNCPVKLTKDSSSFIKLWKQQIQQFQNVGPEVAEAIVSRYPCPRLLLKAYKRCVTVKDAENVLQDIVVRRNYGPLGTQKRIGPELSYKLYLFFTSRDGNQLLKR